jgi:hypothetical protein
MSSSRVAYLLVACVFSASILASAQQAQSTLPAANSSPVRDPQAIVALQQSIVAMGANVPADSTAAGTVTIVAGGAADEGTIRIRTRGTGQTLEELQTPVGTRTNVFSNDEASETFAGTATPLPMQRVETSRSVYFPLPYLAALLGNPDEALKYFGTENLNGTAALHVQASNSYSSNPTIQFLGEFTTTDLWFDAQTALPLQLAYVRRDTGLSPKIRMEVQFSNYKSTSGCLYPATLQVLMNGTQWMTISVQTFQTNLGLTDADFPVVEYHP